MLTTLGWVFDQASDDDQFKHGSHLSVVLPKPHSDGPPRTVGSGFVSNFLPSNPPKPKGKRK